MVFWFRAFQILFFLNYSSVRSWAGKLHFLEHFLKKIIQKYLPNNIYSDVAKQSNFHKNRLLAFISLKMALEGKMNGNEINSFSILDKKHSIHFWDKMLHKAKKVTSIFFERYYFNMFTLFNFPLLFPIWRLWEKCLCIKLIYFHFSTEKLQSIFCVRWCQNMFLIYCSRGINTVLTDGFAFSSKTMAFTRETVTNKSI